MSLPKTNLIKPSVDERFYNLGSEEVQYLKGQTGIEDDDALRAHVMEIQQKAYEVGTIWLCPQPDSIPFHRSIHILVSYTLSS